MTKGYINKCLYLAPSEARKWLGILFFKVITVINRILMHYNNVLLLKYRTCGFALSNSLCADNVLIPFALNSE